MSKIIGVSSDTENIYRSMPAGVFHTKPLSPQTSINVNEDINSINCVTKTGTKPSCK